MFTTTSTQHFLCWLAHCFDCSFGSLSHHYFCIWRTMINSRTIFFSNRFSHFLNHRRHGTSSLAEINSTDLPLLTAHRIKSTINLRFFAIASDCLLDASFLSASLANLFVVTMLNVISLVSSFLSDAISNTCA